MSELQAYDLNGNLDHESIAIQVYVSMVESGDIYEVVEPHFHKLTNFLKALADGSHEAAFVCDDKGPWFFCWLSPWLSGAIFGVWIRQDMRHSREMVETVCKAYELALQRHPILIGYTKKISLHGVHQKMGYTYVGKIEGLWQNEDLHIWQLRREDFIDWRKKNGFRRKQQ